jgi:hypothetical protein
MAWNWITALVATLAESPEVLVFLCTTFVAGVVL